MCTGDAFRLCASEIPDIAAVTACMVKNRSSLTQSCRAVLDREVSKKGGKVAARIETRTKDSTRAYRRPSPMPAWGPRRCLREAALPVLRPELGSMTSTGSEAYPR